MAVPIRQGVKRKRGFLEFRCKCGEWVAYRSHHDDFGYVCWACATAGKGRIPGVVYRALSFLISIEGSAYRRILERTPGGSMRLALRNKTKALIRHDRTLRGNA